MRYNIGIPKYKKEVGVISHIQRVKLVWNGILSEKMNWKRNHFDDVLHFQNRWQFPIPYRYNQRIPSFLVSMRVIVCIRREKRGTKRNNREKTNSNEEFSWAVIWKTKPPPKFNAPLYMETLSVISRSFLHRERKILPRAKERMRFER